MIPSISSPATTATLAVGDKVDRPAGLRDDSLARSAESVEEAKKLKRAYTQFVGEAFYGQMLKAMRSTVGEPAYFHGGTAERQFQAQFDQHLAQDLASDGANGLADQMFEKEFSQQAALLRQEAEAPAPSLADLDGLRRR